MIEDTETLLNSDFSDSIFNNQEFFENAEVVLLPREEAEILKVASFNLIANGFELNFNKQIDQSIFNLYQQDDIQADLVVTDALGSSIDGSIIFNDDLSGFTFVQAGDQLQSGDYTVILRSGDDGIIDTDGGFLDGNDDGTVGDDYIVEFSIENLERVLNLSDLVATSGQNLQPEELSVTIDDGSQITSLALELKYDPNLLDISTIELIEGLPDDWNLETNFPSSGTANITLSGNTPLTSGEQNLIQILGNIPETVTYGTSQIIKLDNIVLNDGEISGLGDTAIHQVALLGDASGDESYEPSDSYLISQLSAGLISNFPAYPYTDPSTIVDLNGDGTISAFDAYITTRDNLDYILPILTAELVQDTGISSEDNITTNGTITGNFSDNREIETLEAGFSDNLTNITDLLQSDGSFTLSQERLGQLNSEDTLSDGSYTLNLIGTDKAGNKSRKTLSFTLDTQSPEISSITNPISTDAPNLTSFLDPLVNDGDNITGTADGTGSNIAEATYQFNENSPISLTINENGEFNSELDLTEVKNSFSTLEVTVTDQAGNTSSSEITVVVPITTPSGLQYADSRVGSGATPSTGDRVTVNYTGFFEDGTIFDSSLQRETPFSFPLGQGRVIQGWDEGVASMNVGTVRRLYIPSELAYGETGIPGTIPPNTLLIFDVDLLGIG